MVTERSTHLQKQHYASARFRWNGKSARSYDVKDSIRLSRIPITSSSLFRISSALFVSSSISSAFLGYPSFSIPKDFSKFSKNFELAFVFSYNSDTKWISLEMFAYLVLRSIILREYCFLSRRVGAVLSACLPCSSRRRVIKRVVSSVIWVFFVDENLRIFKLGLSLGYVRGPLTPF